MSKKIAERPDSLVLDVKFGTGSFNKTVKESLELAKSMIETGELCGINTTALVTKMDDPLGSSVGNWIEVKECIDIMTNKTTLDDALSKDLIDVTLALAGQMLVQGGKANTLQEGIAKAKENLSNGKAYKKFRQMVIAQGGDVSFIDSPDMYPHAKLSAKVISPKTGYVKSIDSLKIGLTGVHIGAGRKSVSESVDFSAGVLLKKKAGMAVNKGDVLAEVYTDRDEEILHNATKQVLEAYSLSDESMELPPLITNFVTKNGVEDFDLSAL